MKSKTLVLLSAVLTVLCLLAPLSAKADPGLAITVKGKITEADGSLAPDGLTVEATISEKDVSDTKATGLRADGDNYALTLMGPILNESKWPSAGDLIEIVVKDESDKILGRTSHTIETEEDEAGVVILDFQLSGIQVDISPASIPGDGRSEATINIKVVDQEGNPVEGDTLTVESSLGASIPAPTAVEGEPGSYQTTYTAPIETGTDTLTITSTKLNQSVTSEIELTFAPALLTVELLDEEGNPVTTLAADGESTAEVLVTIKKVKTEVPVKDEDVKITADLGKVSSVTNNEDGTYTATYTAGTASGDETLTVETKESGSKTETLILEAGPPAKTNVSVAPSVITADGVSTATVTATVTDANDNPINDADVSFEVVGEGTIEPAGTFKEDGKYTSTYTSPLLEEETTETVSASVDEISGTAEIKLVLEPPAENAVIAIHGAIYYEDGLTHAPYGLEVTVKNLTKDIQTTVTSQKLNGHDYNVVFVGAVLDMDVVATTGDEIDIEITKNGEPVEIVAPDMPYRLTSEEVEVGETEINITTNLKAEADTLTVRGAIMYGDGSAHAPRGLEVTVKNLTKDIQTTVTSEKLDGHDYSAVFVGPVLGVEPVATTGDEIEITLKKADGTSADILEPAMPYVLTTAEVVAGEAEIDLNADIPVSAIALNVTGNVYKADGTPIPAGYKVEVTNPSIGVSWSGKSTEGEYSLTLFGDDVYGGTVITSGDALEIRVFDDTGALRAIESFKPMVSEILTGHAEAPDIKFAVYKFTPPSTVEFPETLVLDEVDGTFSRDFTIALEYEGTGEPVTDEEPIAEVTYGEVSDFTNNGDGTYTATYTVDGKTLPFEGDDEVDVTFTIKFQRGTPEEFTRTIKDDTRPTPVIDAVVQYRDGRTEKVSSEFDGRKYTGYVAINAGDRVSFDGSRSFDNVGIAEYEWKFSWIKVEITPEKKEDITKAIEEAGIELSEEKQEQLITTVQDIAPSIAEKVTEKLELPEALKEEDLVEQLPQALPEGLKTAKTMFPEAKTDDEVVDRVIELAETSPDTLAELIAENIPEESIPEEYRLEMRRASSATPETDVEQAALPVITREFLFPKPGVYTVELDVIDVAGNKNRGRSRATFTVLVDQLELGGITVDVRHYQALMDDIVYQLTKDLVEKYKLPVKNLFGFVRSSPTYRKMITDMLPPGLPIPARDAVDLFINKDIEPGPNMALGNFGNAIMPAPISDLPYPLDPSRGMPLTLAGDNLSLYLQVPNKDAAEVVFNLNGNLEKAEKLTGKVSHKFVLEEEQALLLLPSWPGKGETELSPSVFSNVYLYYATAPVGSGPLPDIPPTAPDGSAISGADFSQYITVPMQLARDSNDKVIWTADVELDAGNHYFYFFRVEIEEPIKMTIPVPGQEKPFETEIDKWTMPDPRNLQIEDRGLVEYMVTPELKEEVEKILEPVIKAVSENAPPPPLEITPEQMTAIQNIVMESGKILSDYILESKDPLLVSRFKLPAPKQVEDAQFSLWTGDFDLSSLPDGDYEVTASVVDADGNLLDELPPKQIVVDRNTVSTTLSVAEKENAATYIYEDETGEKITVATVGTEEPAILELEAGRIKPDYFGVGFQTLEYPEGKIWNPVIARTEYGLLIDPSMLAGIGLTEEQIGWAYSILNSVPIIFVPEGAASVTVDMRLGAYYSPDKTKQYWLRSVAMDNALNIGSSNVPIRLDVVPREADRAVVSSDKDIIYPDTEKVTLTVKFSERTVHPVDVAVQYKVGEADWTQIGDTISLARGEGVDDWSQDVEWTPDFGELFTAAGDAKDFSIRAVAKNALDIVDPEPQTATILLRFHPEIIAFEAKADEFSADSGAPKGTVELTAYTPAVNLISPEMDKVEFEFSPDGENWEVLESVSTPEEVGADQIAVIQTLVEKIVEEKAKSAQIADSYSKWTLVYDTTQADDTITKDDGDARDYKLDENPYLVRSTAIDKTGAKHPVERKEVVLGDPLSVDYPIVSVAVEKAIPVSVDNVDDIGPVTGTKIVSITDLAGTVEPVDGKYILGGLDTGEPYPVTITAEPAADPTTFDHVELFVYSETGEKIEFPVPLVFEKTDAGYVLSVDLQLKDADGNYVFSNGDYVIQALAIDETGNIEEADPELALDITIANFKPPVEPEEIEKFEVESEVESKVGKKNLAEAKVEPFPASGILTFYLVLPGVEPEEVDLLYELIEGYPMSSGQVSAMRMSNNRSKDTVLAQEAKEKSAKAQGLLTVAKEDDTLILEFDTTKVVDGSYNFEARVTKRNAERRISLPTVAVDNTLPEVVVEAPVNGIEVSSLPTLVITYSDAGVGIDTPSAVSIEVKSLPDETAVEFEEDIRDEMAICNFSEPLEPGAYQVSVTVHDLATNENSAISRFTVGAEPVKEDSSPPLILSKSPSGTLKSADVTIAIVVIDEKVTEESGVATVTASIDDGAEQDMVLDGTSATLDTTLEDGTHTVKVTATDNSDNSATANWSFTIDLDTTPPIISSTSPQGVVTTEDLTLSAGFNDESGIDSATVSIDGGASHAMTLNSDKTGATYGATNLSKGTHTAEVTVTDASANSNSATSSWSFTVDLDTTPPTISSTSPQGVVTTEDVTLSAGFSDESGIYRARVRVDGGSLRTMTLNSDKTGATYSARNLDEGTHTAEVTVTDNSANRNDATYEWSFTVDLDTTPPIIGSVSPQGVVTTEDVTLSAGFSDESGIFRATVSVDGGASETMTLNNDKTGATYQEAGLDEGTHTAEVTVTDNSANRNSATYEWSFTVDLDTTPPSITSTSPVGIIREEKPMIAVTVNDESGVDSVSVSIEGPVKISKKSMKLTDTSATYDVTKSLEEGAYNATVTATDKSANKNSAQSQWSFTVEFDTEPPEITIVSPSAGARITDLTPKIVANYSDKSEIDLDSVKLTITDPEGKCLKCETGKITKDQNKVVYTTTKELEYGEYTVELEVSDIYENTAVAEWSFFIESAVAGIQVPRNFPNPFASDTTIAFILTKQARVTIKVYDMTSRLVTKPVEDELLNAGPQELKWNGQLTNGDKLAKGVYFCQIIASDGLNTEQAVIKMALFR